VPLGCKTPVVLRSLGKGQYEFESDAYVHGYMAGEAVAEWRRGKRVLEKFVVV
jgi:hypothetical protein